MVKDDLMKKTKKVIVRSLLILVILGVLGAIAVAGINGIVVGTASNYILSPEVAAQLTDVDCILVLGCLVKNDGVPSDMLHDRLRQSVELYQLGDRKSVV